MREGGTRAGAAEDAAPSAPGRGNDGHHDTHAAHRSAELAARASYGRLLAILAAPAGDIALAEDCLADAFARALSTWPRTGVPDNPDAWLLTVARNRQRDYFRSSVHAGSVPLADATERIVPPLEDVDPDAIPDERLALLFVCGHPAIDASIRTPLMLQTVLGFEAKQVAHAFAVPPSAMAQRLVRAKRRIRNARIPFRIPTRDRMPARLAPVLEAIYGAYAIEWPLVSGTTTRQSVAHEAHYLAVTLAELMPDEPEALGLAALLSLSLSRARARTASDQFLPLDAQDPARWDAELIAQGEALLKRAQAMGRAGRFQLEAAIQSVHCARATSGVTDWAALRKLYAALIATAPTLGARVAHAAAVARVEGARAGLDVLDAIEDPRMQRFQPAWATRAHLLAEAGDEAAAQAYRKAISLTTDGGVRPVLERRAACLTQGRAADASP